MMISVSIWWRLWLRSVLVVIGILIFQDKLWAQCCSGGVPMASNLGLPSADRNVWQVSLNYDFNVLRTLKTGTTSLEKGQRERTTHSALLEIGYSFTDRLSLNALFTFVRQERTIKEFGATNFVATNGIGDAIFIIRYLLFPTLNLGGGFKAPLGAYDRTNSQGNIVSADLQPGSGAWDIILWGSYNHQLSKRRPSMTYSVTSIFRITGKNDDFRNGAQVYEFGNEFQAIVGISDQLLIGTWLFEPSLSIKYRNQGRDMTQIVGVTEIGPFPNSGGNFIFINPGLSYPITNDLSVQFNADLPLYANVDGTQLSPTFRINGGIYYRFGGQKQSSIDINPNFE